MITLDKIAAALPKEYKINRQIAKGGQGAVFEGEYNSLPVAIKIVDPFTTEDKRIDREILFLKENQHPNIVKIVNSSQIHLHDIPCKIVAYEFINNGDLAGLISQPLLPLPREIIKLGLQIGSAIECMWSARERIVHRDIKPLNIMLDKNFDYILVDFGFAKHLDLSNMTVAQGNPGTHGYKSPEQAAGVKNLTLKSDVFSLGITIFAFATGLHPFKGYQPLHNSILQENLSQLRPDLPRELVILVEAMLNTSAHMRPKNISEQFRALEK